MIKDKDLIKNEPIKKFKINNKDGEIINSLTINGKVYEVENGLIELPLHLGLKLMAQNPKMFLGLVEETKEAEKNEETEKDIESDKIEEIKEIDKIEEIENVEKVEKILEKKITKRRLNNGS